MRDQSMSKMGATLAKRKVRILVNRRSGFMWSFKAVQEAFHQYWDIEENNLAYQFCCDPEDGRIKARRTVEEGYDILLVVGGDGTVNTIASELINTNTVLGVIPMGSGNGFARHFGIPLKPADAVRALAEARIQQIDVGLVNEQPFLVTCSMAWDAAIVRSFMKSPIRGIMPYVFAGVYEFFEYVPQHAEIRLDSGETFSFSDPLVLTVANLTQFGGGAVIAPSAEPNDGLLELVVVRRQDIPVLLANVHKLFKKAIPEIPNVVFKKFRSLVVRRPHKSQIQIDGELIDAPEKIEVKVMPRCLKVLVPALQSSV